jgi:hypothetical protein
MTTCAIELNDASIAIARSEGLIAAEPGCAIETGDALAFGAVARRSSRLRPRDANDRFWTDLNTSPLARPLSSAKSSADLAHGQLQQLWNEYGEESADVLLAVPGSFDREKLSLLLGIADACGMRVAGLVDAAVAACSCPYPGWDSIHVEAQLHGIGLTRIGHSQRGGVDEAVAEGFETTSKIGVAQLHERWARRIAAAFVEQTRFDPLSEGASEQRLFDALPDWIETFASLPSATVEFDIGEATKRIQLSREEIIAEAADVYDQLADRVSAARRTGRGLAVRVGCVLAGLPGATERLARIEGVHVVALASGAGALGALASADEIRSRPGQTTLVKTLGWRSPAVQLPSLQFDELKGSLSEATHLLIRDTAHLIGARGLRLRVNEAGRLQVLANDADDPADFSLLRCEAGLQLECAEEVAVLVNTRPAAHDALLHTGDRLSTTGSSDESKLIEVRGDGT